MTSMNVFSKYDTINIPKALRSHRCEQREKWRVARQAEKEALAKRGVRLLYKISSGVTSIYTNEAGVYHQE